jgi:YfiH family protein
MNALDNTTTLAPLTSSVLTSRHGFFTRAGGVSIGLYRGLNCGSGSQDNVEDVLNNRQKVQDYFLADALCTLFQEHSPTVITVESQWQQFNAPKADAMVTRLPNIALGILTADCAPVLLEDATAGVIGAAHAGWKGAIRGIIGATVQAMGDLGADPTRITAAIGPCIQQESYQVDSLFHSHLVTENPHYAAFFERDTNQQSHYYFDLSGFVRAKLTEAGIMQIESLPNNTYLEESDFYSFRRTTHRHEPDYGRQISVIIR